MGGSGGRGASSWQRIGIRRNFNLEYSDVQEPRDLFTLRLNHNDISVSFATSASAYPYHHDAASKKRDNEERQGNTKEWEEGEGRA